MDVMNRAREESEQRSEGAVELAAELGRRYHEVGRAIEEYEAFANLDVDCTDSRNLQGIVLKYFNKRHREVKKAIARKLGEGE